jgi:hypothetical protein
MYESALFVPEERRALGGTVYCMCADVFCSRRVWHLGEVRAGLTGTFLVEQAEEALQKRPSAPGRVC